MPMLFPSASNASTFFDNFLYSPRCLASLVECFRRLLWPRYGTGNFNEPCRGNAASLEITQYGLHLFLIPRRKEKSGMGVVVEPKCSVRHAGRLPERGGGRKIDGRLRFRIRSGSLIPMKSHLRTAMP